MPYLQVEGNRCYYRIAGSTDSTARPLVFLHGSGGDSSVWYRQLPWQGNELVVMPDLPGHGYSEGHVRGSVQEYARWLDDFLRTLLCAPCVLAGFSLGGMIAQAYALEYPQTVRGIVLISTGMRVPIAPTFIEFVRNDFQKAAATSCDQAYAPGTPPELSRHGLRMLLQNGGEIYYKDISACTGFDSSTWIDRITLPCLIICGSLDPITPPALSRELARRLPNASLEIITDAAHMVMQEQPELFGLLVRKFVDRVFDKT
ncbi:MAG: alpha/beta hydrolase [Desulfobacterota bacterium]|nr:alpha/beta hydrolase [Thermodesulfobacteriota bacterium]